MQINLRQIEAYAATGRVIFYDHKTTPATECFSNFFTCPISLHHKTFRCAEAAFQAQKFPHDKALQKKFKTLKGSEAYQLAQHHAAQCRPDWLINNTNIKIMKEVLEAKFSTSHPHLRRCLKATKNARLVEHTPIKGRDNFWADDCDGTGQNMLGELLMDLRKRI